MPSYNLTESESLYTALLAVGCAIATIWQLRVTIRARAWSALYWLCLALVLSLPVIMDTTLGIPYTVEGATLPFIYVGMLPAVGFAFVHILFTALSWHWIRPQLRSAIPWRFTPLTNRICPYCLLSYASLSLAAR